MPLQTQQIPEETAAPIFPSSARLSDTAEANHTLPKGAVAEALEASENAEQKRRAVFRVYSTISNTIALLFVGSLIALVASAAFHFAPDIHKKIMYFWAMAFTLNVLCTFPMMRSWIARYDRAVYDAAVKLLPATNDPGRLLPLVDSLRASKTPDEKRQLYSALTELLWNLPATDAALLLDTPRRDALRTALIGSYWIMANFKRQPSDGYFDDATADLAVAIIKTLAGIGDKKSVKALQKIINADAKTPNDTVVRDAAREYLPALKQQIAEDKAVQTKIKACLREQIRDPQKVLGEYLDTLTSKTAIVVLVRFLQNELDSQIPMPVCLGIAAFFVLLLVYTILSSGLSPFVAIIVLPMLLCPFVPTMSREGRKVARELGRLGGSAARLLSLLIDYARGGVVLNGKYENDAAIKAVARLLPLLQPGDAALVPPAQRAYLRSWLKLPRRKSKKSGSSGSKGNNSQTLAILALNALATIGDTKALTAAEAIARRTTRGNYHEADLHEAALRCVDALRMRKN